MSSSPLVPTGTSDRLKSFWSRPEGKTGIVVLIAGGVLALWGWGSVVGYLVSMMADTVHLAILAAELVAILWVAFSERSHMLFRLAMRAMTGIVINIDPIGILKDHVSQMRKRREEMEVQISNVKGQIRVLSDTIAKNHLLADQKMKAAEYAKKQASGSQDQTEILRMQAQMKLNANMAGRLENSNLSYADLLAKLKTIYDMLCKFAINVDFFIEDTDDTVKQAEATKKTVDSGFGAVRSAMAIIRGRGAENEIYDATLEHLAEDASQKLGAMDDFQRVTQNFMDGIDLQNGAVQEDALQKLNQYEQKLLTSSDKEMFQAPTAKDAIPVPAKTK